MEEVLKIIIGIVFLFLAWPIGIFLSKITKEEMKQGKKWFKLMIALSLLGSLIGLILRNDVLLFSFLFFTIITFQSWKG